jgi:transcription antitermination protein NusB
MISRRNIRVKVMQTIYAMDSMQESEKDMAPTKKLRAQIDQSIELFTYLLYFLTEVAGYAEIDARNRASKNWVTDEDRNVNTKLAGNELLWKIKESGSFAALVSEHKAASIDDELAVRKVYLALLATDEYKQYTSVQGRDKNSEKDILNFIFTDLMLPDETFVSFVEEHFSNWQDDADMLRQLIISYLSKPAAFDLRALMTDEKWRFATDLLTTTLNKRDYVTELIKPKLKNWDADRIAQLDMILMQMGVCELLYFETIPTKVTINEYIDIAKEYSTEQSGQFINGILDNIHKDLLRDNKIHKRDFKQKTNG